METYLPQKRSAALKKLVCVGSAIAIASWTGCSSVAPSKTTSGAGTGAAIGGLGGAVVGSNSSMGTATGAIGGAALGALTGGIIGMVQDARDRKEQDRLSQERAYQQELARKRAEEAKVKQSMDEELAIAEGFRISDVELQDAQRKLAVAQERLKKIEDEMSAAKAKKKALDDAHEKTLQTEARIAALEEEMTRLKGEEVATTTPKNTATDPTQKKDAPPSPAVKPGT